MKRQKIIMGMTVIVEIIDPQVTDEDIENVFSYFDYIDNKFSTYKESSEITKINMGILPLSEWSSDMKEVFRLSEETKKMTNGYFDIEVANKKYDPSGLVKGWAINNASKMLDEKGFENYYIDIGGDIQAVGKNSDNQPWKIGIRNPFDPENEIVKVVSITNMGLATSGSYARGNHIYNPHDKDDSLSEIVSLSVIGPNIYEADRLATAAFCMGPEGINFIEKLDGFEGYMIDKNKIGTETRGFKKYVI